MPNVLAYTMSLDNRGFTAPLRQAESLVSGSIGKIGVAFGALAGGFAAFRGIEGFVGAIKGVAETGRTLQLLHGATGQSVHDLVILRKAFDEIGIGAEAVPQVLTMMQAALGGVNEQGQPTKHIFEQLGLSIEALKGRPAIEQIQSIGAAIGQLADQESKMAAVRAIFGRFGGREMLAVLGDPNLIKEASAAYGEIATVQEKNAAAFAKLAVTMEKLKGRIASIFVGVTEQIGPQLTALLDKIKNSFDGLQIGRKIGEALSAGFNLLTSGRLIETFSTVLGRTLARVLGAPEIFSAMIEGFAAVGDQLMAILMEAFKTPIAYFQAGIEAGLARIPKSLGGTDEAGQAKEEIAQLTKMLTAVDRARDQAFEKSQAPSGSISDEERQKARDKFTDLEASHERLMADRKKIESIAQGGLPTIQERAERILKEGPYGPSAEDRRKSSEEHFQNAAQSIQPVIDDVRKIISDAMSPFKAAPLPEAAPGAATPSGDKKWDWLNRMTEATGAKLSEGDRLAKIGGFLGGARGIMGLTEYAKQTAQNTAKMVQMIFSGQPAMGKPDLAGAIARGEIGTGAAASRKAETADAIARGAIGSGAAASRKAETADAIARGAIIGPHADYARRTADSNEKMLDVLNKVLVGITGLGKNTTATFQ